MKHDADKFYLMQLVLAVFPAPTARWETHLVVFFLEQPEPGSPLRLNVRLPYKVLSDDVYIRQYPFAATTVKEERAKTKGIKDGRPLVHLMATVHLPGTVSGTEALVFTTSCDTPVFAAPTHEHRQLLMSELAKVLKKLSDY